MMTGDHDVLQNQTFMLGIGAQKSGTTWLHRYLSSHDEVYLSPIKEMHFFDELFLSDFVKNLPANYYLGWLEKSVASIVRSGGTNGRALGMSQDLLDRVAMRGNTAKYFEFFRNRCEGKKVCGEITPTYSLLDSEHFQKIRQAHPDVRPIFIMREPVNRYWSAMRMSEREGSTLNAIELASRNLGNWQHIARGRYDLTLEALHAAFGEGGYLALFYEELFQDSAIHEICDYLSIRYFGADFSHRHNSSPNNDALPQELESQIYKAFADVYGAVEKQMGRLPPEWLERLSD